jgi:undecaprenyl-diphosphatase
MKNNAENKAGREKTLNETGKERGKPRNKGPGALTIINELLLFAFILAFIAVATDGFLSLDTAVNLAMARTQGGFLLSLSKVFDAAFGFLPMLTASVLITLLLWLNHSRRDALFFAMTVAATEVLITLIKITTMRARPADALVAAGEFSFPSGHTAFAFVLLGLIAYLLLGRIKKEWWTLIVCTFSLLVLLIGFTRVYLNVHWLSDVLGGIFLGGFLLTAGILLEKKFAGKPRSGA